MNYESDIGDAMKRHPEAVASCDTFAEFAEAIGDTSKPGKPKLFAHLAERDSYWCRFYETVKAKGFMAKALAFPHASKVTDIFESATLCSFKNGARTRQEHYAETVTHGAFISESRAKGFAFFGHLGAVYSWSARNLEYGWRTPSVSGDTYTTRAKLRPEVLEWYGSDPKGDPARVTEWSLCTVEAVGWSDGRTLLIAHAFNGFGSRWLAVLDKGETLRSLMSDHERGEIEAEPARRASMVPPLTRYRVTGEDRAEAGPENASEPFRWEPFEVGSIEALDEADARELVKTQRKRKGRAGIKVLAVTELKAEAVAS